MSTARKILSNTFAQILGKAVLAIIGIAVVKITTTYLAGNGVSGYGEYISVYEFLAFFGIAADLGLFNIAVREMSRDEDNIPKLIGNILSLRTILVVTMMILAVVSVFLIPRYSETRIPLGVAVASLTVVFTIINGTLTSVLQTKLRMSLASIATVIGKIATLLFMIWVVFWGYPNDPETGFYMLLVAGVVGMLVTLLITRRYVKQITPLKFRFDFDLWREVFFKALPYGIALILSTIYFRIDSIMLLFMRGSTEVGFYGVAMRILEQLTILPLYFMNSVLPVLAKALKDKSEKYRSIISYSFDFLAALAIPTVVGGVLLAYPIIFIVSDPAFLSRLSEGVYGSDIAFQILVFATLFQFLNVLFSFILISIDKQTKLLYINFFCVIFNITANYFIIPHYGFPGAAFTSVLSELFILICTFTVARRNLEFSLNLFKLIKIAFSAFIMGLAIYILQPLTYRFVENWNVLLLVPIAMAVYAGALFATKAVDRDMLALLKKEPTAPTPEQVV